MGGKYVKRILTFLNCPKYDEINMGHLSIQKHVSYKKMIQKVQTLCIQVHTKVFRCITVYVRKFSKRILMYLFRNKYNEINIWAKACFLCRITQSISDILCATLGSG